MNIIIFNFFFSLSQYKFIADLAIFSSNILIYILFIVAVLYPIIYRKDIFYALFVGATCVASWVGSFIIKNIFKISRPFIDLNFTPLLPESGFSFPSSHVTVFVALSFVVWKFNKKLGILFAIATVFIALSRMIIGVHYPLDLLGGMVLGILIGLCAIRVYRLFFKVAI